MKETSHNAIRSVSRFIAAQIANEAGQKKVGAAPTKNHLLGCDRDTSDQAAPTLIKENLQ